MGVVKRGLKAFFLKKLIKCEKTQSNLIKFYRFTFCSENLIKFSLEQSSLKSHKMKSLLVVFAFLLIVPFSKAENSSNFILGGSNATIEEFPHMVGIMNSGRFSCGGAIINSRSVLTVRDISKN